MRTTIITSTLIISIAIIFSFSNKEHLQWINDNINKIENIFYYLWLILKIMICCDIGITFIEYVTEIIKKNG